jgi:hypothetical protein
MADEPISQLTQISPPPFVTAFTSPTTGAMLEILDTTNTSMASSGTNSKIAPGDLLKGYLAAGTNVTLTETSGIVTIAASGGGMSNPMTTAGDMIDGGAAGAAQRLAIGTAGQVLTVNAGATAPAWANPVTQSTVSANANSLTPIALTKSAIPVNTGFSITLPSAGTYLIGGYARAQIIGSSSIAGDEIYAVLELYDSTTSAVIPNSLALILVGTLQVASVSVNFQQSCPLGPVIYTASGAHVIQLWAYYETTGSAAATTATLNSDSAGLCVLTATRVA